MKIRYLLDRLFIVVAFTLMSGAFISNLIDLSSTEVTNTGSAKMQIIWISIYLITMFRVWERRGVIVALVLRNKALFLFCCMAMLSASWSLGFAASLRHGFAFFFTAMLGVDFGTRYSLEEQVRIMLKTVWLIIISSVFVQIFMPGFIKRASMGASFLVDQDAWIGLFSQKNLFGYLVAVGGVLTLIHFRMKWSTGLKTIVGLGVIFVVLAKAQSLSAVVVNLLVGFSLLCLSALKWTKRSRATLGVASALVVSGVGLYLLAAKDYLAGLLGRTADFTGRTEVWALVLQSIAQRPLLGYGFDAFWLTTDDAARISHIVRWTVPSAHDLYMDIALQLGLLGLLLYVVVNIVAGRRAITLMRQSDQSYDRWPIAYLIMTCVYGITESDPFEGNSLYWVMFVAACIAATRYTQAAEREPAPYRVLQAA